MTNKGTADNFCEICEICEICDKIKVGTYRFIYDKHKIIDVTVPEIFSEIILCFWI